MKKAITFVLLFTSLLSYAYGNTHSLTLNNLQTYVINLDRAVDRYQNLKHQLAFLGISPIRFSAIDGYTLKIEDKFGYQFQGIDLKDKISFIPNQEYKIKCPAQTITYIPDATKHIMSAGELGCYCSHMGIWKDIANKNHDYNLILEDDALISEGFNKYMDKVLNNLPENWDIVYLYLRFSNSNSDNINPNEKFIHIVDNPYLLKIRPNHMRVRGLVAMLVSQEGAKKLLSLSKKFTLPIDNIISIAINNSQINAYRTFETYVFTINNSSFIEDMGRPKVINSNKNT